ncbi:MAG: alpha/beta hydrolase [Rhodocyclales bacterium GT-UBC]|nr:MAG: alpha/beta hydrolase [Rhodocyclales bacterium GT-UBC]
MSKRKLNALIAALILAGELLANDGTAGQTNTVDADLQTGFSELDLQWGKTISRSECNQVRYAVWVEHAQGNECIRYYPSPALQSANATSTVKQAIFFFHGDRLAGSRPSSDYATTTPQNLLDLAQRNETDYQVPFIFVARPGVYGSSGAHRERRRLKEFLSLNAAVDAIRLRHGLKQVILAGQSGGSTAGAALLTLGRKDVQCAALGSGNYAVNALAEIKQIKMGKPPRRGCDITGYCDAYDVIEHTDGIAADPARRILVIGDPQDQNTVFELQRAFYDKLRQAGHRVELIEVEGRGKERHNTTHATYRLAARCATEYSGNGD